MGLSDTSTTSACLGSTPFPLFHNAVEAQGRDPAWSNAMFSFLFSCRFSLSAFPSTGDYKVELVRHSSGNSSVPLEIDVWGALCLKTLECKPHAQENLVNTNRIPHPLCAFLFLCS